MKIAVLIQCHKNARQINLLLETMRHPAFTFFVHVDKKSAIAGDIVRREDVIVLPEESRVDVQWAKISQIDATLNLIKYAVAYGPYDFYWVCSGQDFPIKSPSVIAEWFQTHSDHDFVELFKSRNTGLSHENNYDKRNAVYFPRWILGRETWKRIAKRAYTEITGGYNRTFRWARRRAVNGLAFYFGSSWVCLTGRTVQWVLQYLADHPEYYQFMKNCNCPDESFFQTLVMNSPYAGKRMDYLHYVDWSEGKSSPKILRDADFDKLLSSEKLMARKLDAAVDERILCRLQKQVTL